MPQLFIHVTDGRFHSCDDGGDYDRPTTALASGIRSAVNIAAEEVILGKPNAAVVISVEQEDGTQVLCSVVAVSASPLASAVKPGTPMTA